MYVDQYSYRRERECMSLFIICICLVDFAHGSDWLGTAVSTALSADVTTKSPLCATSRHCSRCEYEVISWDQYKITTLSQ